MQPITIQFAVRVRKDFTPLHVYLGCVWVVINVKYMLHTKAYYMQEACIRQTQVSEPVQAERGSGNSCCRRAKF